MSFQAYLDNVAAKTGKSPDEFKALAREKGFCDERGLRPGVKATPILEWLERDFALGRGHGMALVALFKGKKS
jgi:hypothetical protein